MNRDGFHEEIKKDLKSGNACCHSIQKLSSSRLSRGNINTKMHRTMIFYVVLRGTISYTPKKKSSPKIFENKVKTKVFGPKRDNVTKDLQKLHNENLHGLYSLTSILLVMKSRRTKWAGHVAHTRERRDALRIFMWKTEGNRPGRGWENNIKMVIKEISRQDVDWTDIAQDRGKWQGLK